MKKWKCIVCGYIHTGDEPPEQCPVCGADRSKFVEVDEAGNEVSAAAGDAKTETAEEAATRWSCTVCGYIHTGDAPPDKCPVCGADASLFVEMEPTDQAEAPSESSADAGETIETDAASSEPSEGRKTGPFALPLPPQLDKASNLLSQYHAHPISVHIPNGVLPLSVLFMAFALLTDHGGFSSAAFYNMIFVLLAMPAVVATGYNDWQLRFGGHLTPVFKTKIICAAVVLITTAAIVFWMNMQPYILMTPGAGRIVFLGLAGIDLTAAAVAGYYGGKLVIFPGNN